MIESIVSAVFKLASTYGSGAYGGGVYGEAVAVATPTPSPIFTAGPVSLPNTGAGWSVLIGAVVLAVAAGWWVWLRQSARARAATPEQV